MKSSIPALPIGVRLVAVAGSLGLLAALTGCAVGTTPLNDKVEGASISGGVHGGQQPISGAVIQLYSVGTTGYGTGATALLGGAVTTSPTGTFNITGGYTCPSPSTLVYITATGGNPGGGTNTNSKLMAALGACGNLSASSFISINEVTTAAATVALTPYFLTSFSASTDGFGSPNNPQALAGIANAFTTAATLANTTTGLANSPFTTTGAGGLITVSPETAKLYTIADILAACVNSTGGTSGDGTACGTLFADSGPAGVSAVNTLEAGILLNRNPTSTNNNGSASNLTALYSLITATAPYPAQASQPTDWTVGIEYTGTAATMAEPQNLAIDAVGNVWVVNNASGAGGSLNEITPSGTMLVDSSLTSGANSATANNPRNLAIDLNGNIWVPTSTGSGYVFEYITTTGTVNSLAVSKSPYGIAIDASDDIWISQESSTATSSFTEYLNATLATTSQVTYPVIGSTTTLPSYLAFDSNQNLWATSGANLASASNITLANGLSSASCTAFPCTTGAANYINVTGLGTEPYGIAASATTMWVAGAVGNVISNVTITPNPTATNFGSGASIATPRFTAVDGAGNIWVSNRGTGSISEFSSNGTVVSPVPTGSATTPVGYVHSGLTSANQLAIDPSGNVWVADNTLNTNAFSIFEIVGTAAPTVTPTVLALKNNTIGVKP